MLDFSQVVTQIKEFGAERVRTLPLLENALQEASRRMREAGPNWEATRVKIENGGTSWLVARWLEPPDSVYHLPLRPLPHTVFAADGSQIVSDRHDIALCFLLNVGLIALRYGTGERASLTSRPQLDPADDELLEEIEGQQIAISPKRVAIRRLLAEFAGLAEMICGAEHTISSEQSGAQRQEIQGKKETLARALTESEIPIIALSDGTLILWTLDSETEAFRKKSLEAFQDSLEVGRMRGIPIVGYISSPQSRDVINSLRVHSCEFSETKCDKHCPAASLPRPAYEAPKCAGTERVVDADLFARLLQPGQRSAVFGSRSTILEQYKEHNRIRFFYLHVGEEVARVEIPVWVAENKELLDLTHTLCYDQACKGGGYPVALSEAHEQAIVRNPERDAFFRLMERDFVHRHQSIASTQKAISKRARRV